MNTQFKDQQCSVAGLAFGWMAYAVGVPYFLYRQEWVVAAVWTAGVPALRWALYHFFPRISRFLGYGRIDDRFSSDLPGPGNPPVPVAVTFYTFFSCPFCPIVLARLQALQQQMNFSLTTIDVTLKPQLLTAKQIRSVPVVELDGDRLVGNSTTEQLAALIARGRAAPGHELA